MVSVVEPVMLGRGWVYLRKCTVRTVEVLDNTTIHCSQRRALKDHIDLHANYVIGRAPGNLDNITCGCGTVSVLGVCIMLQLTQYTHLPDSHYMNYTLVRTQTYTITPAGTNVLF